MLLPIHVAAGGLAIILGAVALSVKKGGNIHRRSGLLFHVAGYGGAGDVRTMRFGMPRGGRPGASRRGGPRLARHVWRMCFALFIAAGSFFSVRERVATILPEPLTTGPMRALPIVLLFGTMFYWLLGPHLHTT